MQKNADAFRTISEVAEELALPQHVLRFWETRFPQIRPLKRAGGRRYYRPSDILLLKSIRALLYDEGYTIKGVQRLLKEQGPKGLSASAPADLGHEDSAEDEDVQGRGDSDADVHDGAADEDARQDDHDGEVASPPRSVEPIVPPPRQMFPQAAPSRPAAMDQYGPTFGPAWRAPPAGVLGSLQRDALETALLVLEDCERILAPLVRRPA